MKPTTLFFAANVFFVMNAAANEVPQPDINVGTNWTFEMVDGYTKIAKSKWKNVVEQKTDALYGITRYSDAGSVMFKYKITRNLGQGSPTRSGKIGNGDMYSFPLSTGKSWTYRNYWTTGSGDSGYDEVTYTVAGNETITTGAGTFDVVKVTGTGTWANETNNRGGRMEMVLYYAPKVQFTVRSEKIQSYMVGGTAPPSKEIVDVVGFEIK
jgi:hypothetical protein